MGKGMDGKAGKDLIIKVPCGTLVWRLPAPVVPEAGDDDEEAEEEPTSSGFKISTGNRPVIRTSGTARAMEMDLSADADDAKAAAPTERELVCDLTEHGQQFVICKGGRGGLPQRRGQGMRRAPDAIQWAGGPAAEIVAAHAGTLGIAPVQASAPRSRLTRPSPAPRASASAWSRW